MNLLYKYNECFLIKNYSGIIHRKLFISPDLEMYYENSSRLDQDICDVELGINKVLNRNQVLHMKSLSSIINEYSDIISKSNHIYEEKENYIKLVKQ